MTKACQLIAVIALFVGSGTLVSVVMKITFTIEANGRDGTKKKFQKPWCMLLVMCVAMSLVLLKWWFDQRRGARNVSGVAGEGVSVRKTWLKIALPGFLSTFGTFVQAVGLMMCPVSVYQMLMSSNIIFSAIIRFIWMGKRLARFELCGITLTVLGLTAVGAASVVSGSGDNQKLSMASQITGVVVVLCSQAIIAGEAVIEEQLLHGLNAPAEYVCGMVGLWGLFYMVLIFLPMAQFLPGAEGNGLREDTIETFFMVRDNHALQFLLFLFFVVVLLYNQTMRMLISMTQATTLQVLGGMRTLSVWALALVLYFIWPKFGERWAWYTWIELFGFLTLMSGVFIYRATLKLRCFEYPVSEQVSEEKATTLSSSFLATLQHVETAGA